MQPNAGRFDCLQKAANAGDEATAGTRNANAVGGISITPPDEWPTFEVHPTEPVPTGTGNGMYGT